MDEQNGGNKKLLYDPLFAHKPDVELKGKEHRKFKIGFVIIISIFVGLSLFFSFNSVSNDKYVYKDTENGKQLSQFNGTEDDIILYADFVRDNDGAKDEAAQPVECIRSFAMSCNEYVRFIYIGKDVKELEPNCFFSTNNLFAVIVDEENENFVSVDGVLYSKDMTKILLHPILNAEYRAALADGIPAVTDEESAKSFIKTFTAKFGDNAEERPDDIKEKIAKTGASYVIPETVTEIGDSAFAYCANLTDITVPEKLTKVGNMAFFKCTALEEIYIPDTVESIGSDGYSYCENVSYIFVPKSVKTIGHHAFFGCLGIDALYMEAADKHDTDTGDSWLPKREKNTLKTVEVLYGQERRSGNV